MQKENWEGFKKKKGSRRHSRNLGVGVGDKARFLQKQRVC